MNVPMYLGSISVFAIVPKEVWGNWAIWGIVYCIILGIIAGAIIKEK